MSYDQHQDAREFVHDRVHSPSSHNTFEPLIPTLIRPQDEAAKSMDSSVHKVPCLPNDSDQSLLDMLKSTVACLKHKKMDVEALGCLEQSLWLKRRMFGVENSGVSKTLNDVVLSYNSIAMQYLAQDQIEQCLAMLRKAEAITAPGNFKRCQALQILTFNNIGCCYRKLGKLKSALKYLMEAAQLGAGSAHVKNLSITHLNLCAIQSQLGRHDLALEHAQAAIFHTQEELVNLSHGMNNDSDQADAFDSKTREEKMIALAVAYHNLAVELEFNRRSEASLQWYKKALQLVWNYRDTNKALCESFKKIFLDAKKKQQTAKVRHNGIPASQIAHNTSDGRRPLRPRSAHASSRSTNAVEQDDDISYSSTVASQCYKDMKPSSARPHYGSPHSATATRNRKLQRPSSAAARQRPRSAKPTPVNRPRPVDNSAERAFELHWKKLERKHSLDEIQTPPKARAKPKRKDRQGQRPASNTAAVARRHKHVPSRPQRQQKLPGQLYFGAHDEDIGNDKDYGIQSDDGSSADGFEEHPQALTLDCSDNQQVNDASKSATSTQQKEATRYRQAFDDSQCQSSLTNASQRTSTIGSRDCDDDTDPDVPTQRVCHMEYLRRMKKLAESIKDDLNGVSTCSPTRRPVQVAVDYHKSRTHGIEQTSSGCESRVSTPRSSTSKLREQIEQARHDAWEDSSTKSIDEQSPLPHLGSRNDDEVELQEVSNGVKFEAVVRHDALQLLHVAAVCQIQALFRGYCCRTEVKKRKQMKLENDAAILIQRQGRQFLERIQQEGRLEEHGRQLKLQQEEVEEMAACLIQRMYRRVNQRKAVKDDSKSSVQRPSSMETMIDVKIEASGCGKVDDNDEDGSIPALDSAQSSPRESHGRLTTDSSTASLVCSTVPSPLTATKQQETLQQQSTITTPRTSQSVVEERGTLRPTDAAILIQALVRSFAVRQRIALATADDLSWRYIEQKHFEVALDHALELEQDFLEELSAIKIQALVRGRQSRLLTECTQVEVHTAASAIQRHFRAHRRNIQREVEKGIRIIAACTIQQVFRDYEAQKAAIRQAAIDKELYSVQEIAASTIQTIWRQYYDHQDHSYEEIEAAMCIQALGRGHLTRKMMKSAHSLSSTGLTKESSAFSMHSSTDKLIEMVASPEVEALSINYSFLPPSIRELYMASNGTQVPNPKSEIQAHEIAELGLTFADFLQEFNTCTQAVVGSSALNAMRVVVESSPDTTRTLANVVKVAQALDRRRREGFWNETIEASSIALLHTFRNVLDAH